MMRKLVRRALQVCILPILFIWVIGVGTAQEDRVLDLDRIQRATVLIIQADEDTFHTRCVSSGTIVRFDGLILTDAYTVVPNDTCPGTELIIAMSLDPNRPPIPKYRAEIAQVDLGLNLALLQISRELDGRPIDSDTLPILPFVEIARTLDIGLDDTVTVVGFSDIGNDAVQIVRSSVAGFFEEPGYEEDHSWIKISSEIPLSGTITGGGAYNAAGQLVGIPVGVTGIRTEGAVCYILDDTNNDGFINNNDSCVPIGDVISVLRPALLARSLIRSASLGLQVSDFTSEVSPVRGPTTETPEVSRLFFATAVSNGLPNRVIGSAPAGTDSLYLFFDYVNFSEHTIYEVRVSVDGVPNDTLSLPPVRWSGNDTGMWYIGNDGQPWPNGSYEFQLFIDGFAAASRFITVGGTPEEKPTFSNVVFGLLDEANNLQGESYVLPGGKDIAFARFIYQNLEPGIQWTSIWYYNGLQIKPPIYDVWTVDDGTSGSRDDVIRADGGLRPGKYRVELYLVENGEARLKATGDFIVAGAARGVLPDVFSDIRFYRGEGQLATEGNASTSFSDGADEVYAQFNWQHIAAGTLWTVQWLVDDTIFYEATSIWSVEDSGTDYTLGIQAPGGLPDGTYTLNLLINGLRLETAEFSVGIGQLEIESLERLGDTLVNGQVVDADTGIGIEGATIIFISEDFSIADFTWDQEQIYALAVSDRAGNFEIDRPLDFETPYSVYIIAEGYLPITADGFLITAEQLEKAGGSPLQMSIPLTKD